MRAGEALLGRRRLGLASVLKRPLLSFTRIRRLLLNLPKETLGCSCGQHPLLPPHSQRTAAAYWQVGALFQFDNRRSGSLASSPANSTDYVLFG